MLNSGTIAAISTPKGVGGIAVIRISGENAINIVNNCWKGKSLVDADSHTAHLGQIVDSDRNTIDQVVATIYKAPHSFTGENTVEISCHGSSWIQQQIINILVENGCSPALAGEFSQRAFINRKIDLTQAEAIADLIASSSRAAHKIAINQMKGNFSNRLNQLRNDLLNFASLIELELDFSEEDVEFANRDNLTFLAKEIKQTVDSLASTFAIGNALKKGIPVAIAGATNVGKSTLLNALLQEEKAIVSDIHGTTRDVVEDTIEIDGILFRFIDTAGIRKTSDVVENLGIERTLKRINTASLIMWVIDPTVDTDTQINQLLKYKSSLTDEQKLLVIQNKKDLCDKKIEIDSDIESITISAKTGYGIDTLIQTLTKTYAVESSEQDIIITNARHYSALNSASRSLERVLQGLNDNISSDFIAQDIRETIHHLSEITGEISTDDLLGNIFSHFCIGK